MLAFPNNNYLIPVKCVNEGAYEAVDINEDDKVKYCIGIKA